MIYSVVALTLAASEPIELSATSTGSAVIRNTQRWAEMRAGLHLPANHTAGYTAVGALPATYTWGDIDGESLLTTMRNQHIPVRPIGAPDRKATPDPIRCTPPTDD